MATFKNDDPNFPTEIPKFEDDKVRLASRHQSPFHQHVRQMLLSEHWIKSVCVTSKSALTLRNIDTIVLRNKGTMKTQSSHQRSMMSLVKLHGRFVLLSLLLWSPSLAFRAATTMIRRTAVAGSTLTERSVAPTASLKLQRIHHTMALQMVRNRGGLEQRREGATPTEGGLTLYVKAGPDGLTLGDCPFAHFVRMVLETKGLKYELIPCIQDTKPGWLKEFYDGKLPALRHRKECYVESDTIAAYLEFFFPKPELTPPDADDADAAEAAVEGLFPAVAQYVKHTPDGDEVDAEKEAKLRAVLQRLNDHLSAGTRIGPYLVGDGSAIRMNDCKVAPVLYHMCTAVSAFKGHDTIDLAKDFPAVKAYTDHMFQSDASFQKTVYPAEVVVWGWGNARGK